MYLFTKGSPIMNAQVSLKNQKTCERGNYSQSKNSFNLFEADKNNANVEKIDRLTTNAGYDSNNI